MKLYKSCKIIFIHLHLQYIHNSKFKILKLKNFFKQKICELELMYK